MTKRLPIAVILLVGAFWLISPFVLGYHAKTAAVDNLTNDFRPVFSDSGEKQTAQDIGTVNAFAAQFQKEALPGLAKQLNVTPDQLATSLGENYPDVGAGLKELPTSLPYFNGLVTGLQQQQDNFHQADSIPTGWLPAKTVFWLFVILGVLTVGLGVLALVRPKLARNLLWGVAGLGVAVVIVTFALHVNSKAKSVDEMTDAFRPVFTTQGSQQTRDYLTTLQKMDVQLNSEVLPGLAKQLGVTPAQLSDSLAEQYPDVATGLKEMPGILQRFDGLVTLIEDNVTNFQESDHIPTSSLSTTWLTAQLLIPAVLLVIAGAAGAILIGRHAKATGRSQGSARTELEPTTSD